MSIIRGARPKRPIRWLTSGGSHPVQHVVADRDAFWPMTQLATLCGRDITIAKIDGSPRFTRKARLTLQPTPDHPVCRHCRARLAEFDSLSVSG